MLTPGIIHGQRVVRYKRIPPAKSFTHSQFLFGAGNSDAQRYNSTLVNAPSGSLFVTVNQTRRCFVYSWGNDGNALRISQNLLRFGTLSLCLSTPKLKSFIHSHFFWSGETRIRNDDLNWTETDWVNVPFVAPFCERTFHSVVPSGLNSREERGRSNLPVCKLPSKPKSFPLTLSSSIR